MRAVLSHLQLSAALLGSIGYAPQIEVVSSPTLFHQELHTRRSDAFLAAVSEEPLPGWDDAAEAVWEEREEALGSDVSSATGSGADDDADRAVSSSSSSDDD